MNTIVSAIDLVPGDTLQSYCIERTLERKSNGVVYLATDTVLDYQVVIKEYFPIDLVTRNESRKVIPIAEERSEEYHWGLDRFIKEAQYLARFKHPNIVPTRAVFQNHNTAYKVMDLIEGVTLHNYLRKLQGIDESALIALILPVAKGLAEIHRGGLIHKNINPWNILVCHDGTPILSDYGSTGENAESTQPDSSIHSSIHSSSSYVAIEQLAPDKNEQQGPWTDVYALGGILYLAISGDHPVECTRRMAVLLGDRPDPLIKASVIGKNKYTESLLKAVDWALQIRITDRPQTLENWIAAIRSNERVPRSWSAPSAPRDDRTLSVPGPTRGSEFPLDADATGQFGDFVSEEPAPRANARTRSKSLGIRIIGFPIISTVLITLLIAIIVAAIFTGD